MDSTITNEPVYLVCADGSPMRLVAAMVERVASGDVSVQLLPGRELEPDALEATWECFWPGNVRELEALAAWLALMAEGRRVRRSDVAAQLWAGEPAAGQGYQALGENDRRRAILSTPNREIPGVVDLPELLQHLEYVVSDWALEMSAGSKTVASDLVGLHRTALIEKACRRQFQGVGVRPSSRIRGVLGAGVIE
jgi:DNA-binding NtrC family response regulator